jgi:N-methylhydantoinase B
VIDDYVSIERAAKDYGVVIKAIDPEICEYEIDEAATNAERETIAGLRQDWLATPAEEVAAAYRAGSIDKLDVVRRYAVVLDWKNGALLPNSTEQFRDMFRKRSAAKWAERSDANSAAIRSLAS